MWEVSYKLLSKNYDLTNEGKYITWIHLSCDLLIGISLPIRDLLMIRTINNYHQKSECVCVLEDVLCTNFNHFLKTNILIELNMWVCVCWDQPLFSLYKHIFNERETLFKLISLQFKEKMQKAQFSSGRWGFDYVHVCTLEMVWKHLGPMMQPVNEYNVSPAQVS